MIVKEILNNGIEVPDEANQLIETLGKYWNEGVI